MSEALKTSNGLPDLEGQLAVKGGRPDSLRSTILSFVAKDKFDVAVRELRYYQQYKSDISVFHERTERYFDHCEELILAVKAKKGFPNIEALPMAKRQEIFERIQQHFDELQNILRRIEQIENDIKVQDARSTVWVIQALIVSSMVVTIWAVAVETSKTMGMSFTVMFDDVSTLFFKILGI